MYINLAIVFSILVESLLLLSKCSHEVPTVFTLSSQCIHDNSSLNPICFALSFTLLTYITSPKEKIATYIYFRTVKSFFFFFWDGPIKGAHHKRKKIKEL